MVDSYAMRLATAEDVDFIYELANDVQVRENSFCTEQIPYENHIRWYSKLLSDSITNIQLIYICNNIPVGQCRIKVIDGVGEIGVSICAESRGKGIGKQIFNDLADWTRNNRNDIKKLRAQAKNRNLASINSMLGVGFEEIEIDSERLGYREFELLL